MGPLILLLWATGCARPSAPPRTGPVPDPDRETAMEDSAAAVTDEGLRWVALPDPPLAPRISGLSYLIGQDWLIWGGEDEHAAIGDGARLDLSTGTWATMAREDAPGARSGLLNQRGAVGGGADGHVLVWGGHEAEGYFLDPTAGGDGLRDGAIYHVATDTWTPMAKAPDARAFAARNYPHAVWTGEWLLLVGGGSDVMGDARDITILEEGSPVLGSRFSPGDDWTAPDDDVWLPMRTTGAPGHRKHAVVAWTGSELLVWGGQYELVVYDAQGLPSQRFYTHYADGFLYDPARDRWRPMSDAHGLSPRSYAASCWTGEELLVWGGLGDQFVPQGDGAAYDPRTDTWRPIAAEGAPSARGRMGRTEWTGAVMVVWGGVTGAPGAADDGVVTLDEYAAAAGGAAYDPVADAWIALPDHRAFPGGAIARHHTVWTGDALLVWGGWSGRREPYGVAAALHGLPGEAR